MNKAVQIVTIKNKIPLFKGEEQANSIEKIELEENGFSLVCQKDLYEIGEKAIYIQPDYCLSDIPLFESFIRPNGDPKKSRLGSNNRIRAIKFNLHTGDHNPIYSVGILLPYHEVWSLLPNDGFSFEKEGSLENTDLDELLGITKWEEPEGKTEGIKTGGGNEFPSTIYKTDETNINNLWGHLEKKIGYPVRLIGSKKVDGSSISLIYNHANHTVTVGSRKYLKPTHINKTVGYRKPTWFENIRKFFTGYLPDLRIKEKVENNDEFVVVAKPYIDVILSEKRNESFILRGEVCGQRWKGSGNKNNPDSKQEPKIYFYGLDVFENGVAVKADDTKFFNMLTLLNFKRCPVYFNRVFISKSEIEHVCNAIFKLDLIEGIVLRTPDSKFSAKFMNDEYDSKK